LGEKSKKKMDKIEKKEKKPFFFSFFDVSFIDIDF
jgi:hypothetical protein